MSRKAWVIAAGAAALCGGAAVAVAVTGRGGPGYDPLAYAREHEGRPGNREATVPPACYLRTGGRHNTCWTCHTQPVGPNEINDADLQVSYAFSAFASTNHWENVLSSPGGEAKDWSDGRVLDYVRADNYRALRAALKRTPGYQGFVPDVDLEAGFDEDGFARDGSGWREVRYKPFPSGGWPTSGGNAGEVLVRLPPAFRRQAGGGESKAVYQLNLALLEAAVAAPEDDRAGRRVEPVDERLIDFDLDGDGALGTAERVHRLPETYAGAARGVKVERLLYPEGTEFLHPVRYLDPDAPSFAARRMKELRYSRKVQELGAWGRNYAYEEAREEKERARAPHPPGNYEVGLRGGIGWQLQGFIEDADGRLRAQTTEEHLFCMGCHANLGVLVDGTFALPRKVPGRDGWRAQDLRGMKDVPQAGHAEGEVAVYLRRAGLAHELGENDELAAKLLPGGNLDEAAVRRAGPGGDQDLASLLLPSRERALVLDRAYLSLVKRQRFDLGRDALPSPARRVLRSVEGEETRLTVLRDGRLHLRWE
ncbi:MAG TPA: hypothetical protein VIG99_03940 [Myxococcaceae bacterium]